MRKISSRGKNKQTNPLVSRDLGILGGSGGISGCPPGRKSYWPCQLYNLRILLEMQKETERFETPPNPANDISPLRCSPLEAPAFPTWSDLSQNRACLVSYEAMTYRRQGAQKLPRAQDEGSQKSKNMCTNCWLFG